MARDPGPALDEAGLQGVVAGALGRLAAVTLAGNAAMLQLTGPGTVKALPGRSTRSPAPRRK